MKKLVGQPLSFFIFLFISGLITYAYTYTISQMNPFYIYTRFWGIFYQSHILPFFATLLLISFGLCLSLYISVYNGYLRSWQFNYSWFLTVFLPLAIIVYLLHNDNFIYFLHQSIEIAPYHTQILYLRVIMGLSLGFIAIQNFQKK